MPKFFVNFSEVENEFLTINGENFEHISKSLRMPVGDELVLCDGVGYEYHAVIDHIDKDFLQVKIFDKELSKSELAIKIFMYQALPKSTKMELIVQKNVELGAYQIIPCETSRCIVKADKKDLKKTTRLQKISEEAAKQSGRAIIPQVLPPISFKQAVEKMLEHDLAFVPYEGKCDDALKDLLLSSPQIKEIGFMIGSEGGFSPEEIAYLKEKNIKTVTLGNRILRCETAGMAVSAMIAYELGDVNKNN